MAWASIIIGAGTAIYGGIKKGQANKKMRAAQAARTPFETPDEIYDIVNATQARAGNGLGSPTLDYLTGQTDRAASAAYDASTMLGGDPNNLSAIFDQKMQNVMKIGAENHAANLANFSKYIGALDTLAQYKTGEFTFKDNMAKDKIQAAAAAGADATKMIESGVNSAISGVASYGTSQLYKNSTDHVGDVYGDGAQNYAEDNGLNFNQYKRKGKKVGGAVQDVISGTSF